MANMAALLPKYSPEDREILRHIIRYKTHCKKQMFCWSTETKCMRQFGFGIRLKEVAMKKGISL